MVIKVGHIFLYEESSSSWFKKCAISFLSFFLNLYGIYIFNLVAKAKSYDGLGYVCVTPQFSTT